MRSLANEVCAKFVKICAIRGQKSFAAGEAKSALIRLIRVISVAIVSLWKGLNPVGVIKF